MLLTPIAPMTFGADKETVSYFTEGQCNALAWELYKLHSDWKLVLISTDPIGDIDLLGRVAIMPDADTVVDIEGVKSLEAFKDKWKIVYSSRMTFYLDYFHIFRSRKEYQKEMECWDNDIHYTKDAHAKDWAQYISTCINETF